LGTYSERITLKKGVVLVGGYFRYLYAYRAEDGALLWQRDIGSGINASPMVYRGLVYAASGGTVYAVNVADGALAWRRQTGYSVSPGAVAHGVLYVAEAAFDASGWHDRIHALRASDGEELWSRAFAGDSLSIAPGLAVANGVVYMTSWSGQFRALDAHDGSVLKSIATGPVVGSPTVANGLVYIGPWNGKVQAFGVSGSAATR
jgi:outer membrane protein assembly factor BamB